MKRLIISLALPFSLIIHQSRAEQKSQKPKRWSLLLSEEWEVFISYRFCGLLLLIYLLKINGFNQRRNLFCPSCKTDRGDLSGNFNSHSSSPGQQRGNHSAPGSKERERVRSSQRGMQGNAGVIIRLTFPPGRSRSSAPTRG